MLRPPAPVIRSSPFDVGALLNACIIIIIIIFVALVLLIFASQNIWSFQLTNFLC